ncbi:MAG TPA: pseudouridine synthase [Planctomycetota bacterium]|nr:pseudouridine synthase [Planctomycetota bacterium]
MSLSPTIEGGATAPAALRVLFVDEHLVAVSKPSGLLVHRDEHHPTAPAALQLVRDQLGRFLYPVHRLDRPTSGILLFAFASATAARLQASMTAATAHKDYVALVRWPGSQPRLGDRWRCEQPLADDKAVPRAASSAFELQQPFRHCALLRCRIFTGRYHQIRRHLERCGRPVLGDPTYGSRRVQALFSARYGLQRLFLHLQRLLLLHPVSGEELALSDPLPADLTSVLAALPAAERSAVTARAGSPPPASA